jgi:hypothetical protein
MPRIRPSPEAYKGALLALEAMRCIFLKAELTSGDGKVNMLFLQEMNRLESKMKQNGQPLKDA